MRHHNVEENKHVNQTIKNQAKRIDGVLRFSRVLWNGLAYAHRLGEVYIDRSYERCCRTDTTGWERIDQLVYAIRGALIYSRSRRSHIPTPRLLNAPVARAIE